MRTLVTLTTDFGTRDTYVAQLKGVLYALGPRDLELVDLTHEIGAQQVMEAALFVRAAWPRFPPKTLHLVVVDPGVGSARRGLACAHGEQHWVGPDNGVMSLLMDATTRAVSLAPERFVSGPVSATFHGRDVFAPALARLAQGAALETLGDPTFEPVQLCWPAPHISRYELQGTVLHVDRFGNVISNITRAVIEAWQPTSVWPRLRVRVGNGPWLPLVRCYADVAEGSGAALIGSSDWLEVAVNCGDAGQQFGAAPGATLEVCVLQTGA
jgi:S-adenosylmethionine hydrolase